MYTTYIPGVVLVIGMRRRFSPHELFLMMIIKQSKRQVLGKKPPGKPHCCLLACCVGLLEVQRENRRQIAR